MQPLSSHHTAFATPLFRGLEHHLALQAILQGSLVAPLYVDNAADPQMAFTWTQSRAFVGGECPTHAVSWLTSLLEQRVWPQAYPDGADVLVVHPAPGPWEERLADALAPYHPQRHERHHYALRDLAPRPFTLPAGYTLRPVDTALLGEPHLCGRDALVEEMLSERPSVESFLEKSFGVCPVVDDTIVGWCLSEYNTADRCEVGIATAEGHQRRGIASAMTHALVAMARERGIREIGWHCWDSNLPSQATAVKAGFTLERRYPVYVAFWGDPTSG